MLFYSVQFYSVNTSHNKIQTGLYSPHLVRLRKKDTCANISGSNAVLIDIENLFAPGITKQKDSLCNVAGIRNAQNHYLELHLPHIHWFMV